MRIDFHVLKRITALMNCQDTDYKDFGENTCCDCIESIHWNGDPPGVTMFIEPCGTVTKHGYSLTEVLDWWIAVFKTQPEDLDYIQAAWYLDWFEGVGFPDDPKGVWGRWDEFFAEEYCKKEVLESWQEDER